MPRELTSHKVNGLNEALTIKVIDEPDLVGACHVYDILGGKGNNVTIRFQKGPILENGVNGISNEALLAIVRDRLECFQKGPFYCEANAHALDFVMSAQDILASRTRERTERGVEGTHAV